MLNIDAARAELGAGEHDQTVTVDAVNLVYARAAAALAAGARAVTIDATASTVDERGHWLALASDHQARPVITVFWASLATTLARNAARDRQVPEDVLTAMWHRIARLNRRTLYKEGFHLVTQVVTEPDPTPDAFDALEHHASSR